MRKKVTQFVEHLRSKSEETRQHIMTISMIAVIGILVLVWIATLGAFSRGAAKKPVVSDNKVSPFQLLKTDFTSSFQTVSTGLQGIRNDLTKPNNTATTSEQTSNTAPISATGDATVSSQQPTTN